MMLPIARKFWQKTCKIVLLGAMTYQCLGSTTPSHNTTSSVHLFRRFLAPDSSRQTSTGLGANGGTYDPCGWMNLTAETWQELGIDEYITNYPNAKQLTIQQFAAELNVPNFFCGIGSECSAGQLCSPATGINWIILYAIQEWNAYMNSFYSAIEDAISTMKDCSSDIASDFMPRYGDISGLYGWSVATVVVGALASFSALIVPAVMPVDAMQMVYDAAKVGTGAGLLGAIEIPQSGHTAATQAMLEEMRTAHNAAEKEPPENVFSPRNPQDEKTVENFFDQRRAPASSTASPHATAPTSDHQNTHLRKRALAANERPKTRHPSANSFTHWSHLTTELTVLQNELLGFVSATVQIATMQPLLADGGIATILKGGSFLYQNPTQLYLDKNYKALAQITALSNFFRAIKMFVTIGSDDCKYDGPNGAKNNPQDLSYCNEQGLMMNIVRAEENKVVNKMENAGLLKSKYGYSVKDLATIAWDCQKKYGVQNPDAPNFPPPVTPQSDCVFYIPVCDCTLPKVAHLRKKKKGTVKACRDGAGLPL